MRYSFFFLESLMFGQYTALPPSSMKTFDFCVLFLIFKNCNDGMLLPPSPTVHMHEHFPAVLYCCGFSQDVVVSCLNWIHTHMSSGNWLKRSSLSGLTDGVEDLLDISSVDRLSFIRQSSKVRGG